jgi:hypothetical protein
MPRSFLIWWISVWQTPQLITLIKTSSGPVSLQPRKEEEEKLEFRGVTLVLVTTHGIYILEPYVRERDRFKNIYLRL